MRSDELKVLHLLGCPEDNGGILSTLRGLASADPTLRVHHTVWVREGYQETRQPALDYRRSRHALDESSNHLRLAWAAVRSFGELRRLLHNEPFDLVHAHSRGSFLVAVLVAQRLRRPAVFTNHTYARRRGLYRWGAQRPGLTTVVLTPNMARHYGFSTGPGGVEQIPECCADGCFARPLAAAPGQRGFPLRLIGIGNLVAWKKWDLLVRARAALPPSVRERLTVDVWGPTPADPAARQYAQELEQLIAQTGQNDAIRLRGPTTAVADRLVEADWMVLPSTNEPCSVALLEALAQGLPALVSNSGGNVDLVAPGRTGRHFTADDVGSLSEQLRQLVEQPQPAATPGEIRDSVRAYAANQVAAAYRQLYERVIGR